MEVNIKNNKTNLSLKQRKKPKGYSRFLRNVIKEKTKVMKEIIQNRFFKWRKDALRGKIRKTVMIRIAVSKEKEPKNRYLINKPNPKEFSKSVNKNDYKAFNINNIPKDNINNIRIQNVKNIEKEDKEKNKDKYKKSDINKNINTNISNRNKNTLDNKKNNKEENKDKVYKKININKNKDNQPNKQNKQNKQQINTISNIPKAKPIPKQDKVYKHKINITDYEIPKETPKTRKTNPIYSSNTSISNKKEIPNNYKNYSKDLNKNNNNNIGIAYSSSSKQNYISNYRKKNNLSEIPKEYSKAIGKYHDYTSMPVKTVKIDLTEDNKNKNYNNVTYNPRTFKRQNRNDYNNLAYNKTNNLNNKLLNTNTYHRKDNTNNDNKSVSNYSVKSANYNNETFSPYSRSRKDSNVTSGPTVRRPSLKEGLTTVIQHYSGQRRKYENYNTNSYKNESRKK